MKRIFIGLVFMLFIFGCSSDSTTEDSVEVSSKGTFELLISSDNVEGFDSIALKLDKMKIYKDENILELSLTNDAIEMVKLNGNNAYSVFQTALDTKNYTKLELIIDDIKAYKKGEAVDVSYDVMVLEKDFNIKPHEITSFVFDIKVIDGDNYSLDTNLDGSGIIDDIVIKKRTELSPIWPIVSETEVEENETDSNSSDEYEGLTAKDILKPQHHTVTINGGTVTPNDLVITKGETVVWENLGRANHMLYCRQPYNYFRTPRLETGMTYNMTFNESGIYRYTSAMMPAYIGASIEVK